MSRSRHSVWSWGGQTLRGPRVSLRPLSEDDPGDGHLAITLGEDDSAIGVLQLRVGRLEGGWLEFERVFVEPERWGFGLESEAVRLVEEDALARGLARRFWARVDREDGLGVYFWLRLGYRPSYAGDDPWPGERASGIMAMVRVAGGSP